MKIQFATHRVANWQTIPPRHCCSVVCYSVLTDSEQLFASKYRLVLPSEEQLRLERERHRIGTEKE